MGDKPFLGLVVPFVPALGCILAGRFCIVRRIRRGNHYLPRRMTCVAVVPARKTT
jgi:hypothetical protein